MASNIGATNIGENANETHRNVAWDGLFQLHGDAERLAAGDVRMGLD